MSYPQLAKALRAKAESAREKDSPDYETTELILVLARIVEGKTLDRAFGAPGDWGYGTPIGDGVFAMLKTPLPQSQKEAV